MSENLLGGAFSDDEEEDPLSEALATVGGEAFAAAIVAIASRQDPSVARDTSEFLKKQSRLIDLQAECLEDEHELRISHLRHQQLSRRLRIALQFSVALVAVVIGIGVIVMLRDAFTSRSVVVEAFDAPFALAERGLSGKVVALGLLDELTRLQQATRSPDAKRRLANAWANDLKLSVPDTGLSVSDISRALRSRFGHDLLINGDLVETRTGGLALTVRGTSVPPRTFSGSSDDLDALTIDAAEYVYSQSQPVQWAAYLVEVGRYAEAVDFCRAAIASVELSDRPAVLLYWGAGLAHVSGSLDEPMALWHEALKIQPDFWDAYDWVMAAEFGRGDAEGAWRDGEAMRRLAGGRPGRVPELMYEYWDIPTWNLGPYRAALIADAESRAGAGTQVISPWPQIALVDAQLHDPEAAEQALRIAKPDPRDPTLVPLTHFVRGELAADAGDSARAEKEMEAYQATSSDPFVRLFFGDNQCWIALTEEAAHQPAKADALLASAGTYVDCLRFRGDILDGRGDWAGAQKAYARAVALAPDLPSGYYSWGVALGRHGDLAGAEAKLQEANQRGPHWAEPLKAWGDLLAKSGHRIEALLKYDEALRYAPNWAALKSARHALENPPG